MNPAAVFSASCRETRRPYRITLRVKLAGSETPVSVSVDFHPMSP
jgi:hypothetical protein